MKGVLRPYGLLAELTHRCPLQCPYCSNPLRLVPRGNELPEELWIKAIREAAALGVMQIGFSGGEPLLYPHLLSLISTARETSLYSNLITSGLGLDRNKAWAMAEAGLDTVQISFQSDEAVSGDQIAGMRAHDRKLAAVQILSEVGLPWSANIVLHRRNMDRLESMISMVRRLGAIRVELANTQFYGWAFRNLPQLLPTREQIEEAKAIVEKCRRASSDAMQIVYILPDYYERRPKPCLHGWASRGLTINPRGDVLPCQAAEAIPGLVFENIRDHSLAWIWEQSDSFNRFRGTEWMPNPCQSCDLREIDYGGCRCQAALLTGDPFATDPVCELSPHRHLVDTVLDRHSSEQKSRPDWIYRGALQPNLGLMAPTTD